MKRARPFAVGAGVILLITLAGVPALAQLGCGRRAGAARGARGFRAPGAGAGQPPGRHRDAGLGAHGGAGPLPHRLGRPGRLAGEAGRRRHPFRSSAIEKRLVDAGDDLKENQLAMEKKEIEGSSELRKLEKDAAMARMELADAKQFQKKDSFIFSRADIIESEIDPGAGGGAGGHAQATRQTRQKLSGTERPCCRSRSARPTPRSIRPAPPFRR